METKNNSSAGPGAGGITELRDFHLLEGKLLYASSDFIGYDPLISRGLAFESVRCGTKVTEYEFELNNASFRAVLTYFIDWGPLRGYRGVEIIRDGKTLIRHERGGKGHGSNYSAGKRFHIDRTDAFLVYDGNAMKDLRAGKIFSDYSGDDIYLFWFRNIVIPGKIPAWPGRPYLAHKKTYAAEEIEPLRRVEWAADINIIGRRYHIERSSVPGFFQTKWGMGESEFCRTDYWSALSRTDIRLIR